MLGGQDGICMWSRTGPTTATFPLSSDQKPALAYPSDASGVLSVDKKKAVLKLGTSPVVITGLDPFQAFPLEMVDAELAKLGPLVAQAKAAGNRVPAADTAVGRARDVLKSGRPAIAYDIARTFVQLISQDLGTYAWVEGELPISHSFDRVASAIGASGGGYLELDSKAPAPMAPYNAAYTVPVTKDSVHEIWLAGLPAAAGASPFSFSIDNEPWQQASVASPAASYSKGFAWMKIGSANLTKGQHLLQIRVDGPGSGGGYKLSIDAIVISPTEFKPNGIIKP
jgi:hypothetical protein